MPTYQVFVGRDRLTKEGKQAVATAITEGHVAVTGAPVYYVQVIIHEVPEDNLFIGGKPFSGHMWLRGDVRCRTPEVDGRLMTELVKRVSRASGFDRAFIWCDLCGIEPTDIMKFEAVFPSAGEEKAWYEGLPDRAKKAIEKIRGE